MNKKLITLILTGVGVFLIIFSFILLCVSAGFVGDVEDLIGMTVRSEYGMGFDFDVDADMVRMAADLVDDLPNQLTEGMNVKSILRMVGIKNGGFKLFALNSRGWFFGFGIISFVAAAVMMAIDANKRLGAMALELVKAFGAAVVAGFRSMISGINFTMPKMPSRAPKAATFACPKCGAPFVAGTPFCGACGERLPDAASLGICKNCGTQNEPGARFCSGCGQPMQ